MKTELVKNDQELIYLLVCKLSFSYIFTGENKLHHPPFSFPIFFCLFFVYLYAEDENPTKPDNCVYVISKLQCRFVLSVIRNFMRCHVNHVNRARISIGLTSTTHACHSFKRQILVNQNKKFVAISLPTWLTAVVVS